MKIIIHTDPSTGEVAVTHPMYGDDLRDRSLTDDKILAQVLATIPSERNPRIAESETLLQRDTFRNAWEVDAAGKIVVNMTKARLLHMQDIRVVRNQRLTELDIPFIRAVEIGDSSEQERIRVQKQVLRDIPETFALADYTTPESLKAAWPDELS